MEQEVRCRIVENEMYELSGYGSSYIFKFIRMYGKNAIMSCSDDVSYYWCHTFGGKKGGTFNGACYVELPIDNLQAPLKNDKEAMDIHDWAVSKMLTVSGMKISNAQLAVTMKIVYSMMSKLNISNEKKKYLSNLITDKAIDIIDIKQYEWSKLIESQANQLPF